MRGGRGWSHECSFPACPVLVAGLHWQLLHGAPAVLFATASTGATFVTNHLPTLLVGARDVQCCQRCHLSVSNDSAVRLVSSSGAAVVRSGAELQMLPIWSTALCPSQFGCCHATGCASAGLPQARRIVRMMVATPTCQELAMARCLALSWVPWTAVGCDGGFPSSRLWEACILPVHPATCSLPCSATGRTASCHPPISGRWRCPCVLLLTSGLVCLRLSLAGWSSWAVSYGASSTLRGVATQLGQCPCHLAGSPMCVGAIHVMQPGFRPSEVPSTGRFSQTITTTIRRHEDTAIPVRFLSKWGFPSVIIKHSSRSHHLCVLGFPSALLS